MFVQVIEGRVGDEAGLRTQIDRWLSDLAPGAVGWLGSTGGFADDGTFIITARFESAEAAKANGDRPEQGEWWAATAAHFDGEANFRDYDLVDTFGRGGTDDAGFVQIMQGHGDRDGVVAEQAALDEFLARTRPDVHGGIVGWDADGGFTQVVYFNSEEEARKNEQAEMSPEDTERFGKIMALMTVERYIDLRQPMLHTP